MGQEPTKGTLEMMAQSAVLHWPKPVSDTSTFKRCTARTAVLPPTFSCGRELFRDLLGFRSVHPRLDLRCWQSPP
jgi:hypothetical protein